MDGSCQSFVWCGRERHGRAFLSDDAIDRSKASDLWRRVFWSRASYRYETVHVPEDNADSSLDDLRSS